MKEKITELRIIDPVDVGFLSHTCKNIEDNCIINDLNLYTCESCNEKLPFNKSIMYKDFVICEKCATKKKLKYQTIKIHNFLEDGDIE